MNKQEIDDMMKDLPSQQLPDETLIQKITVATIFILILFLMVWVPDFTLTEDECDTQESTAYVRKLCHEGKKP
jgi:hypothetical protein